MTKRKTEPGKSGEKVVDYRHKNVTRLNIPPAGLEAEGAPSTILSRTTSSASGTAKQSSWR